MVFQNENTYLRMKSSGKEDEFDINYDHAIVTIEKDYFGREYPILVPEERKKSNKISDVSPLTGKVIATFQSSEKDDVSEAIIHLKKAQKEWYSRGYIERSLLLLNAADNLSKRKYIFSAILAYENGKNRYEAMGDVDEAIDFMRYYALNLMENQGFEKLTGKAYYSEETYSMMKPYGVFSVIAPFNFFSITVGMTVAPLVTGNAVLLKPSSDIPLSSYLFVKLLHDSGLPEDIICFLTGSGESLGDAISSNDDVAGLVFTGSRETGMNLYHKFTAKSPKVVITEMGGKDAIIVTEKANLEKAVSGVLRSAFGYSGQKCSACSIVFVQDGIYDTFMDKFMDAVRKMKVGDIRKKENFMGPVVNKSAFEKYKRISELLPKEGKILTGGKTIPGDGFFVEPTVIEDLKENSFVLKDELFLPILAAVKVKTLKEAIDRINAMDYGLTGGIFTEDPDEIREYFDNIEVGVIYANRSSGGSSGAMVGSQAFVGWKMSGSTGKGTGSFYYLTQFLREQSQTIVH